MHDVAHGRFEYAFLNKNKTAMAKDTATGRNVCIKRWERGDLGAVNEIAVLTSVSCKGVPGFICSFEDEESRYMAEEWIEGITLEEYIKCRSQDNEENVTGIILQLCSVVEALHKSDYGYLHLDIKPSNIMINDKNEIYLIDFESARTISGDSEEGNSTVRIVSEGYSAPETFFGKGVVQSDIFSIGKVAEALFSGIENVRLRISKIIAKCTSFYIEDRYTSVFEVKEAFSSYDEEHEKSLSVLIDYNMCFSGELGSVLAEKYDKTVGIFALSERGENRLVYYSMPGEYFTHRSEHNAFQVSDNASVVSYPTPFPGHEKNVLFYKGRAEWIKKKCLHKVSEDKELYISGMNFVEEIILNDYEEAQDFIEWAKQHFDIVIIATDRNDDDVTSDIMCCLCDYIITTPQSNIDDIEAVYQFFKSHAVRNGYDASKVLYVAWDYDEKNSLPEESVKIMVGQKQYLGSVNRLDCRQYKKNYGVDGKLAAPEGNPGQYEKIINRLLNRKTGRV